MEDLARILVIGGLAVTALSQIFGAFIAFQLSALHGVLSLIVPGYVLFAVRRAGAYWKVVGTWFAGVSAIVIGMVMLS